MEAKRIQDIQEALSQWDIRTQLHHTQTMTSAVTTSWGVEWDETYIARDIMQNFFDANRACLDEVVVTTHAANVAVSAPAPFNWFWLSISPTRRSSGRSARIATATLSARKS